MSVSDPNARVFVQTQCAQEVCTVSHRSHHSINRGIEAAISETVAVWQWQQGVVPGSEGLDRSGLSSRQSVVIQRSRRVVIDRRLARNLLPITMDSSLIAPSWVISLVTADRKHSNFHFT